MKKVVCKSGIIGKQAKLRSLYINFIEYLLWTDIYPTYLKLGYKSAKTAWRYNPTIQFSINPNDYCKV